MTAMRMTTAALAMPAPAPATEAPPPRPGPRLGGSGRDTRGAPPAAGRGSRGGDNCGAVATSLLRAGLSGQGRGPGVGAGPAEGGGCARPWILQGSASREGQWVMMQPVREMEEEGEAAQARNWPGL